MKRLLGFILGASLGVATGVILRRAFSKQNQPENISPAVSAPSPSPQASTTATTTEEAPSFERPSAKFTVRRTGPRPQAPVEEALDTIKETDPLNPTPEIATPLSSESLETNTAAEPKAKPEKAASKKDSQPDDFLPIHDLGEVSNRKLHEAGITTYQALADTSVEKLSEITGFPVSRIEKAGWVKQASQLAQGLPIEISQPTAETSEEK